jgi:hypothetical protein
MNTKIKKCGWNFFGKAVVMVYSSLKLLWFLNFLKPVEQAHYVNSCVFGLDIFHTEAD